MSADPRDRARLEELLGTEATQGLSAAESAELDALLAQFPDEDPDGLERAAAAVALALTKPEEVPARLLEKLHLAAVAVAPAPASPRGPRPKASWLAWSGWAVAASLLVVGYLIWPRPEKPTDIRNEPTAKAFVAEKAGASGEVVWSNEKQTGQLEVRGLPPLAPTKEQYQLWIVDGARTDPDHKQPVSGGVFDVKPDGTAVFRVHAAVAVKDAKAFAVTKEVAGGVIVSKGPMLLVMTPKQG